MKLSLRTILPVLVGLMLFPLCLSGQNNAYRIDDDVYALYEKGYMIRHQKEVIPIAEKAMKIASEKGDHKAECVVQSLYLFYYGKNNLDSLHISTEKLRKMALDYGLRQYYYYAFQQEMTGYLNSGQHQKALSTMETLRQESEQSQDEFGLFTSYRSMGQVYEATYDRFMAIRSNLKAINHFENSDSLKRTQSANITYCSLARLYALSEKKDSSDFYMSKAFDSMKTAADSVNTYLFASYISGMDSDMEGFYKYFPTYKRYTSGVPDAEPISLSTYAFDYLFRGDIASAEGLSDRIMDQRDALILKSHIYRYTGQYRKALEVHDRISSIMDSANFARMSNTIAELSARVGTEKVRREAVRRENNFWKAIYVILFIFLLTVMCTHYRYLKRQKKENEKLKALNAELEKAKEKAENGARMEKMFVQNMSHEIRTPLNAIVGFSQLLGLPDGMISDDEKSEYLSYIMNNSNMLTMLVDDILVSSDMDSGNYKLQIKSSSCNSICRAAISSTSYRAKPGVNMSFEPSLPDTYAIDTDNRRVQQILVNFLSNACKNTDNGLITLRCNLSENRKKVIFSVTDTGCGVPEEKAKEIFKRFSKLDNFKQGTGLGLSICSDMAGRLGGEVGLDSTYKNGARFYLSLPISAPEN